MCAKYRILIIALGFLMSACYQKVMAQYCIPEYENSCISGGYINKFTFHTISNGSSGCNGNAFNYILYPESGSTTTSVSVGGTYSLSVKSNNQDGIGIWIDYNNDEDFDDAGEFIYASPFYDNITFTGTVIIPNDEAFTGTRRLRVRGVLESLVSAEQSCTPFADGETEDYIITITPAASCVASPVAGTITAFPSSICAAGNSSELLLHGFTVASGILISWEKSADGFNWEPVEGAADDIYITDPLYSTTYFRARVTCVNSGQFTYSNEVKINVGEVKIWTVINDSVCGAGMADLQVLSNANTVSWYESETSGLPLYTSAAPFLFSPLVTATKTYYAAGASGIMYIDSVGLKDKSTGSGSDAYQNDYLVFSTLKACKLTGVHVYPSAAGPVIIRLRDQYFQTLRTDTFLITADDVNQKTFIALEYNLDPGIGFQLTLMEGSVPLWSNQAGVSFPYEIPGVLSLYTSNLGPNYYFYFYNWVVNYTNQCETPRVPVTAYVSTSTLLNVITSPVNATICANSNAAVVMQASSGYTDFLWSPSTGLSSITGETVTASPLVTTTYTLTASDSICQNQISVTVTVANTPSVTVTSNADSICSGTSTQLFASAAPLLNYAVEQITYLPESGTGAPVLLGEDEVSAELPIGFPFKFYGNYYGSFRISSNGFMTFETGDFDGCCAGQPLPSIDHPNNLIAFAWEDLSPQLGGEISYFVTGTAPDRKLIIRFDSIPHYALAGGGDEVTAQVMLYESSNRIEIHTASMPGNPAAFWQPHTMGIENMTGTLGAAVPSRNGNNTWTASNDAWCFRPIEYLYEWFPAATLDDPFASNPVALPVMPTKYTVIVTDSSTQCTDTGSIYIKLINKPKAGTINPSYLALCDSGTATLTLTDYTPGASIQWKQSADPGGPYTDIAGATGNVYTTPLMDNTGFYIAKVWCNNVAFTGEAMLEVMPVPLPPSGDTAYRCSPGKVELQATATGSGTISWYDAPSGGNYLGQGLQFTTPPINASTLFWIEEGPSVVSPLLTTFSGGNTGYGNMFDVTAVNSIMITGFEGHAGAGIVNDMEIYYRKGSYSGYEHDAGAWTLIGSAGGVQGQGIGLPTPYPVTMSIAIPAGNTVAFYITSKTAGINFTYGNAGGGIFAEDANIQIAEGIELQYPFGTMQAPVRWNGIIHYEVIGCVSERNPVAAIIHIPLITTNYSDTTVCNGESITITAENNGEGEYLFQWLPVLPSMVPADGTGPSITVTPEAGVTFSVTATEVHSGCDTMLFIPINLIEPPVADFIGLPDTSFITDAPYLLTGSPPGGFFSGNGVAGNFFDPELAGLGGPYAISYVYSDTTGCIDDTVKHTVVLLETGAPAFTKNFSIRIFPNPSAGYFTIAGENFIGREQVTVVVRDLYGCMLLNHSTPIVADDINCLIDLTNRSGGVYFVEVQYGDEVMRSKVSIE